MAVLVLSLLRSRGGGFASAPSLLLLPFGTATVEDGRDGFLPTGVVGGEVEELLHGLGLTAASL